MTPREPGELPDPPENLDFLELPEEAQELYAQRFGKGANLTRYRNKVAREAWITQVNSMLDRRRDFNEHDRKRKAKAREKHMANRATVGQLAERHRER